MKKTITALWALLGIASIAYAIGIPNPFVNEAGLAYNKRYTIDLSNAAVNTVSATAVYSSATFANSSFSTGQVSTGSFTIADNTKLSTATATNNIVVTSTSGACGDSVVITKLNKPGAFVLLACRDWNYKATTALTAASIKAAMAQDTDITSIVTGSTIYSTATTTGANANAIGVTTNNDDTLTIANATFTGGRDAEVVTINGYAFKFGVNVPIGAAASNSASNLSTAINAKAKLSNQITASPSSAVVSIQSDAAGSVWNFSLKTSNTAAVTVLHPTMIGGSNPSWTLNSKNIIVSAHGYTRAIELLYRPGSGAAAISGLTAETTYYAIPVDANTLQLASSSANAQAGTGITLASTSTLTAAKTYSLLPLSFGAAAGTGGKWQVSNDNSSWSDVNVSSFSWIGGGSVAGSANWDLGKINYRYLSLNVVGANTGGLTLTVTATGSFTP